MRVGEGEPGGERGAASEGRGGRGGGIVVVVVIQEV